MITTVSECWVAAWIHSRLPACSRGSPCVARHVVVKSKLTLSGTTMVDLLGVGLAYLSDNALVVIVGVVKSFVCVWGGGG